MSVRLASRYPTFGYVTEMSENGQERSLVNRDGANKRSAESAPTGSACASKVVRSLAFIAALRSKMTKTISIRLIRIRVLIDFLAQRWQAPLQ
jgi:hypothetical protein